MTADGVDVRTCKNQTSRQRFWSEHRQHIRNSKSVTLTYKGPSEDSGETNMQ